jgi:hypothetical protein
MQAGKRMAGPIVAYEGGSGGGTYTLLIRGRFRQFSYSEPIPWHGLRRIEDLYLGSVISPRQHRTKRGNKVTGIEIVGLVNGRIRSLWNTITNHYEKLARGDYPGAYADFSPELQHSIPFNDFKSRYLHASFDLQPIIIVQPNPLSRYGIIAYGINILRYSRSSATARVELRHFIQGSQGSLDYRMTWTGTKWSMTSINGPN